jgi:hypothetical protein
MSIITIVPVEQSSLSTIAGKLNRDSGKFFGGSCDANVR